MGANEAIIKATVLHANEDGTTVNKEVDVIVSLDEGVPGRFSIEMPEYMRAVNSNDGALELPFQLATFSAAVEAYEKRAEHYSGWKLASTAAGFPQKILIANRNLPGLCLSVRRVYECPPDQDGALTWVDAEPPHYSTARQFIGKHRAIPFTEELWAHAQSLVASIERARAIIDDFFVTSDPAAYLLQIGNDWAKPGGEPVPGPAEQPVNDGRQAELPLDDPGETIQAKPGDALYDNPDEI